MASISKRTFLEFDDCCLLVENIMQTGALSMLHTTLGAQSEVMWESKNLYNIVIHAKVNVFAQ